MSEKIKCEVIQDLLPLYVDDLTSSETKNEIEKHILNCQKCNLFYSDLKSSLIIENQEDRLMEIDYLKKIRTSSNKKYFFGILSSILIVSLVLFLKLFIFGTPTNNFILDAEIIGDKLVLNGELLDSGKAYSGYKLNGSGENKSIVIYSGLVSPFNKSGGFEILIPVEDVESYISIGEKKVKDDGTVINSMAVKLFEAKNPYIGNMSANGRIANILMISENLGGYKNFLKTNEEPYSWKLIFAKELKPGEEEFFNSKMTSCAFVLLALVDNVSIIEWEYEVSLSGENEKKSFVVTKEEASIVLGDNIKNYSVSYEELQKLLYFVGIN